jgi:hypothetical protein
MLILTDPAIPLGPWVFLGPLGSWNVTKPSRLRSASSRNLAQMKHLEIMVANRNTMEHVKSRALTDLTYLTIKNTGIYILI